MLSSTFDIKFDVTTKVLTIIHAILHFTGSTCTHLFHTTCISTVTTSTVTTSAMTNSTVTTSTVTISSCPTVRVSIKLALGVMNYIQH